MFNADSDNPKLTIEYDAETKDFRWLVTGSMPVNALVGTLQLISSMLMDGEKMKIMEAMQRAQASKIAVPNGRIPGLRG